MTFISMALHRYQAVYAPASVCISFVDNIEQIALTLGDLLTSVITQESFLELFQLSIDKDKTYAWALQPRALQSLQHRVSVQERDLGGLMTYGKRRRTSFHDQIIAGVRPCWQQLQNSNMHGHNKILVVYQALWPRIFHSACISDLGTAHIQQLRLGHGKAGANPGIRLGLLHTTTLLDPGFYQLWTVLQDFRRVVTKMPSLLDTWSEFMAGFTGNLGAGPLNVATSTRSYWMAHRTTSSPHRPR